jgi:hypothetical protein
LRDEIIKSIVGNGEIKTVCQNIAKGSDLADDLYNEVVLIFCEMPTEKLIKLYNSDHFRFYAVRTVLNTFNSNTSPFARKYRHNEKTYPIQGDVYKEENTYSHEKDTQIHLIERELEKLSAKTGIPFQSIWKTVSNVRKKIKGIIG